MKTEKWIIIIIIILLIIAIIYVFYNIKVTPEFDRPVVPFSSVRDKFKTGDVLMIHGSSWVKETVMRNYLGCSCSHVGLIVKKPSKGYGTPDELYVLELGPYGPVFSRNSDVKFRPMDQILKESAHGVFGWLPCEKEIDLTDKDIKHYKKYLYNYFIPTMFSPYKKYKVCSSFVAKIHEDKGIGQNTHVKSPCDYYNHPKTILFSR